MIQSNNSQPFQDNSGLAEKRMIEFRDLMNRFEALSWKQVRDIINIGIWDVKERDRLSMLLILAQKQGLQRPCEIPNLDLAILQAVTSTFHIAESTGGYAGLGSMVFTPELSYDSFEDFNSELL